MGYYTKFIVRVYDTYKNAIDGDNSQVTHETKMTVARAINQISHLWQERYLNKMLKYHSFEPLNVFSDEEMKWYDCVRDIVAISQQFPDLWFVVCGAGEERNDNWRLLAHNGTCNICQAQIVYEGFCCEDHFLSKDELIARKEEQ